MSYHARAVDWYIYIYIEREREREKERNTHEVMLTIEGNGPTDERSIP